MKNVKFVWVGLFQPVALSGLLFLLALLAFSCEPTDPDSETPEYPFTLRLHRFEHAPGEYYLLGQSGQQEVTPSAPFVAHVDWWLDFLAASETLDGEFLRALHVRSESVVEAVWLEPLSGDTGVIAGTYVDYGDFITVQIDGEAIDFDRNADFTEVRWCEHMTMRAEWRSDINQVIYRGPSTRPCFEIPDFNLTDYLYDRADPGDTIVYIPYDLVYRLEE